MLSQLNTGLHVLAKDDVNQKYIDGFRFSENSESAISSGC
jgi:hypothetical protein